MAKKEFGGTVYVRTDELTPTLLEIQETHGLAPNELTRRLLAAACQFYEVNGWFSFPVVITPEKFHLRQLSLAAEAPQAGFNEALVAEAVATPPRTETEYPRGKKPRNRAARG